MEIDLTLKRQKNLKVLQIVQSSVFEILEEVNHTAVYEFETSTAIWNRMDVEGSVFVTHNSSEPLYSLIVLNKKGPDDFILQVPDVMNCVIQESYLMLRCRTSPVNSSTTSSFSTSNKEEKGNSSVVVFGLWIPQEDELLRLCGVITRVTEACSSSIASGKTNSLGNINIQRAPPNLSLSPSVNKGSRLLSLLKSPSSNASAPSSSASIASNSTGNILSSKLNASSKSNKEGSQTKDKPAVSSPANLNASATVSAKGNEQLMAFLKPKIPIGQVSVAKSPETKGNLLLSMLKASSSTAPSSSQGEILTDGQIAAMTRKSDANKSEDKSKKLLSLIKSPPNTTATTVAPTKTNYAAALNNTNKDMGALPPPPPLVPISAFSGSKPLPSPSPLTGSSASGNEKGMALLNQLMNVNGLTPPKTLPIHSMSGMSAAKSSQLKSLLSKPPSIPQGIDANVVASASEKRENNQSKSEILKSLLATSVESTSAKTSTSRSTSVRLISPSDLM